MSKKFALLNFADGFNVVLATWMYDVGGQLYCKWLGRKTQVEHETAVKKEIAPDDDWEGKMVTEEIGYFGKICIQIHLQYHGCLAYISYICSYSLSSFNIFSGAVH